MRGSEGSECEEHVVQIEWPGFSEEAKFMPRPEERAEEEGWMGQSS